MGAGRKTKTTTISEMPFWSSVGGNSSVSARNLSKSDLGGLIFGCKHNTMAECLSKQLFGLPPTHYSYVRNVEPGLPLFLFNYSDRKLHGIYEAAGFGTMNIDPYAWTDGGTDRTAFPAQVNIRIKIHCQPLTEDHFRKIILDNFYTEQHFWFELDHAQTRGLMVLFRPSATNTLTVATKTSKLLPELPANKWKSIGNPGHVKVESAELKNNFNRHVCLVHENKFASLVWNDEEIENCESGPSKTSSGNPEATESRELAKQWKETGDPAHLKAESAEPKNKFNSHVGLVIENECPPLCWDDEEIEYGDGGSSKSSALTPEDTESREAVVPVELCEDLVRGIHLGAAADTDEDNKTLTVQQATNDSFQNEVKEVFLMLQKLSSNHECLNPISLSCENDNVNPVASPGSRRTSGKLSKQKSALTEEEKNNIVPDPYHEISELVQTKLSEDIIVLAEEKVAVASGHYHGSNELVQVIKELKQQTAILEKKQVESNQEIQILRDLVKQSERKFEELKDHVKDLESKLDPSMALVDDSLNKFVEQYFGPDKVIYLIGGFNGSSWLSALDSFSPSLDILTPLKSMSSVRSYAAAAALHGRMYVFGGGESGDGSLWCKSVDCYNPSQDEWAVCPAMKCEKGNLSGATLNGKIYAIGGGTGSDCYSDVEMFDPALGRWINTQRMLQKRFALSAAELHGALYSVGGYDGKSYLHSAERYDPREPNWTRLPNMKSKRACHSLAVLNEKLYAIGGYDEERMISSVEIFDPRLSTWVAGEPMKSNRGFAASVVLDDSLLVFGGVQDGENIVDNVKWNRTGRAVVGPLAILRRLEKGASFQPLCYE